MLYIKLLEANVWFVTVDNKDVVFYKPIWIAREILQ